MDLAHQYRWYSDTASAGVAERYLPVGDGSRTGSVTEFPKLNEFAQVTIRAGGIRSNEKTKELTIQNGELIV